MEILNKYIYAIGQKLPMKGREEIKKELYSLLLDEIEEEFGENPTDENIKTAISRFGSPAKVAKEYTNHKSIIANGFSELYFLLIKIISGSIAIAFFTIFIISLFTNNPSAVDGFKLFITFLGRVIQSSISVVGLLTIVFIIITRTLKDNDIELDDDWTVKELECVTISKESESKLESILAIVLIPIFISLILINPKLIQYLENLFLSSGLQLGNRVNMDVFTGYLFVFCGLGLLQVIYHALLLYKGEKTRRLNLFEIGFSLAEVVFTFYILINDDLFIYTNGNSGLFTASTIGIKIFFAAGIIISIADLISKSIKFTLSELKKDEL